MDGIFFAERFIEQSAARHPPGPPRGGQPSCKNRKEGGVLGRDTNVLLLDWPREARRCSHLAGAGEEGLEPGSCGICPLLHKPDRT